MIRFMRHSKRSRPRMFSRIDGAIHLNMPSENAYRKANLLLALLSMFIAVSFFHFENRTVHSPAIDQSQVQIIQVAPTMRAVPQVTLASKPPLRRQDPDQPTPAVTSKGTPPPPVFGLPEAATNQAGDIAVATGNTLMKHADSVVQKPPPALSEGPKQLTTQPAVLDQVIPDYPAWAEEQGVTATVQLLVTIDAQGHVQSVSIVGSSQTDFTRNAIKAVRATRFQPYIKDGVALPAQFLFTYRFVL